MRKSVAIDYLPESVARYREGWTIVVVDVIRATTTAITAVASGRRCFPAPSIEAARLLAARFPNPILAGETRGEMPEDFEMDNSPSRLAARTDVHRPLVLVSSSGTRAIHEAASCEATYLACFRNYSILPAYLAQRHSRIAVIGAGSKGEFREEDQICCAWIAAGLIQHGYTPESTRTTEVIARWRDAPPDACLCSHSVEYLRRTKQLHDLNFILAHIDDLRAIFPVCNGEVGMIAQEQSAGKYSQPVAAME